MEDGEKKSILIVDKDNIAKPKTRPYIKCFRFYKNSIGCYLKMLLSIDKICYNRYIYKKKCGRYKGKNMTWLELYELLEIPNEVKLELIAYGNKRTLEIPSTIINKIMKRVEWEEGIKELQEFLGDDSDGIKILWELLNMVINYSYKEYVKRKISEEIFVATMRFCTRFLNEHYKTFQTYKFNLAWWFPRQISLKEFRIGSLEYEFVDVEDKEIAVHIPSDANLNIESVFQSLKQFYEFRNTYFSEWKNVKFTCETWMMMPELKEFMGEHSNVVAFQNLFEIDTLNYDATWYMEWIFPGYKNVDETLPERTTLQRKLKKHLLDGKKFGVAKGHLKNVE